MVKQPNSPSRAPHAASRRRATIAGAVVVFLALVAIAQLVPGSDRPSATAVGTGTVDEIPTDPPEPAVVRRQAGDPMATGPVDAPVVLVQWTDMRCPYCAVFNRETLPKILAEYVATGKVRVELRDVAFFGRQSENAAVAARAAGVQGRFFEYIEAVYGVAPSGGHPDLPRAKLVAFAKKARVPDLERFAADLDSNTLRELTKQSTTDAQRLGVNSVPFFVAGDQALSGAQPIEVFRRFLDEALARKR
jgi:protein-disulfide isomerase